MALTVIALVFVASSTVDATAGAWRVRDTRALIEIAVFSAIVAGIGYGAFVYLLTRVAYLHRLANYRPAGHEELRRFVRDEAREDAVFIVPSYREGERVILQTLLSCALQEYPRRRVVLLIDDPPTSTSLADEAGLRESRRAATAVHELMALAAGRFREAERDHAARRRRRKSSRADEIERLRSLYEQAALWFEAQADAWPILDHTDRLFVDRVLLERAATHRARALELATSAPTRSQIAEEYRSLTGLFDVEVTSFERKRYANLSHAPNKAMNVNSYLGLIGAHFRERERADGTHLERCEPEQASLSVPPVGFVITVDADTLLLPGYAVRLIQALQSPGNERVAVIQTPYSAVPGARALVERLAGATTDVQYVIHQGLTAYNATFWVGANAVLRWRALEDLREEFTANGQVLVRYIKDRTVIEDTESSLDLVRSGWTLFNVPERLSYSATPPDFGALLIQRRRWANGGLLIAPMAFSRLLRHPSPAGVVETWFRLHYLVSLATTNLGVLVMLLYPFPGAPRTLWLVAAAIPYFALYARDMTASGYRLSDLPRVYALNVLLIVVNLAGVLKSLEQALRGRPTPFGRTPKVADRTGMPARFVLAELVLLVLLLQGVAWDALGGRFWHAWFAGVNALALGYAIVVMIGPAACWQDLRMALPRRLLVEPHPFSRLPLKDRVQQRTESEAAGG